MKNVTLLLALVLPFAVASGQEVIEVTPIAISPVGEDYSPIPRDSGFVMCSIRETQSAIAYRDQSTAKPLSDLYWVPFADGKAGIPQLFSQKLASPVNEGPATFANSGRTICYTRNLIVPKKGNTLRQKEAQLGLFFSHLDGAEWQEPIAFEHNSPQYSLMHPSFSPGGDSLLFASDMPGSLGGVDLYMSIRTDEGWTLPSNLGPSINTEHNEAYPRLGNDGTLHFSSDRPGGLGKLDIFFTKWKTGAGMTEAWATPTPLPEPINGPGNDLGYETFGNGFVALFSSDRDGQDRIHMAKRTVPKFRECAPQQKNNYCFAFKTRAHAAMSSLPLDHVWELGDGTRIMGLTAEHCFGQAGNYTVRSILVDRKTQSVFHVLKTHDLVVEDREQAYIASPDTIRTGRNLVLDPRLSILGDMVAAEYHWNLGDGNILSGKRVQHSYREPGAYTVSLDILSAPDEQGVIHNRCNTKVVHVIDKYREHEDINITAVYQDAFGKTHSYEYQELPFDAFDLATDDLADVKFSVELFTSKDRISLDDPRFLEINKLYRVVEQFDPVRATYVYSVGETKDMEELYAIFKAVKELDFMEAEVFMLKEEKLVDLSDLHLKQSSELDRSKLRVDNIHFAYKSAELEESSKEVLEHIAELLGKYHDLQLVIEAHTDDVGSGPYNMGLSQERALSVVEHLIDLGFSDDRFVAIGHGKNHPIASNKTEKGRRTNRRVEFRMSFGNTSEQALRAKP